MRLTLLAMACALLIGCSRGPNIKFGEFGNPYQSKPDFAAVEYRYPLTRTEDQRRELQKLTVENLKSYDQEQVDQIYARLTAGPVPNGAYDGDLFFAKGMSGEARLAEIAGGLKGLAIQVEAKKIELLGRLLWKGKVFDRTKMVLRNRVDHLELLTDFFPQNGPDLEKLKSTGDTLLFPAKLYCGQSLLDSRRESVIIDYAFMDDLKEYYHPIPDSLAGRDGFLVRDEIRMVRPGFYIGRAYLNGIFGVNFTLVAHENPNAGVDDWVKTGQAQEDCWTGAGRLSAALH